MKGKPLEQAGAGLDWGCKLNSAMGKVLPLPCRCIEGQELAGCESLAAHVPVSATCMANASFAPILWIAASACGYAPPRYAPIPLPFLPSKRAMNHLDFWSLIDQSRQAADGDADAQIEALRALLSRLPPPEIVEFGRLFSELHLNAYAWNLWGEAYVIGGGCSDDGFSDFRGWLISRGQKVYEQALESPDSLADAVAQDEETQIEGFEYLPREAWAEATGQDEDDFPDHEMPYPAAPKGTSWREDELARLYPKLTKKFD